MIGFHWSDPVWMAGFWYAVQIMVGWRIGAWLARRFPLSALYPVLRHVWRWVVEEAR